MRALKLAIPIAALAVLTLWMMTREGPRPSVGLVPDRGKEPAVASERKRDAAPPSPGAVPGVSPGNVTSQSKQPEAKASGTATITGVVYDISGASSAGSHPLEDATVLLSLDRPRDVSEVIEVRTEPDGRFSVSLPVPSSASIEIVREDFVPFELPGMLLLAPEVRDLGRINLPRGGRILGRVIDEKGLVVGGARIILGDEVIAEADEGGAFEIRGLPWGILSLRAECEGYSSITGPELEVQYRINEELRGVVLRLANYRRIAGVVRNERGDPIEGAKVFGQLGTDLAKAAEEAVRPADPLGRWKYEKIMYWLHDDFSAQGEPRLWEMLSGMYGSSFRDPFDRLDAGWSAIPEWVLNHYVRRERARPELLPRKGLWGGSPQTFHSQSEATSLVAETDENGHFELLGELVDRPYDLTVHRRGYDPVEFAIERPGSKQLDIELTRQPWLRFTVSSAKGLPIIPRLVEVRSDFHARDWTVSEFWSEGDEWYVGCPENGNWQVRVSCPLHKAVESKTRRLAMGEVGSVGHLSLMSASTECFDIVDGDREPIQNALMTIWVDGVEIERRSDSSGRVCIPQSPGVRSYAVSAAGYVPIDREVLHPRVSRTIKLRRSGWLEGTVFGFDEKPLAGVAAGYFPNVSTGTWNALSRGIEAGGSLRDAPPSAVSDAQGRFQIMDLPPGPGILVAGAEMRRAWLTISVLSTTNHVPGLGARIHAGEATEYDVELSKLYGDVGGRVLLHGEPAPGLKVLAQPVSYTGQPTETETGLDGGFSLPPLVPGTYAIEVFRDRRPLHRTAPFDLSAGARPRLAIHVEHGSIRGLIDLPVSVEGPGSVVLHDAEWFETNRYSTHQSLRTLVKPDRSFSFPQVGPGDYVVTGLDRGAGVIPARVRVTADHLSEVVLQVGEARSVEVEFDWSELVWERSAIERTMRFTIADSESGLRWSPAIQKVSANRWWITGLESCDRLNVTSEEEELATIGNPFAERDGPIEVALKWDEVVEVGVDEGHAEESSAGIDGRSK